MNMFHIAVPWFIAPLKAFQECGIGSNLGLPRTDESY